MRAMLLEKTGSPLEPVELPDPEPGESEIRIAVEACGVCRTDLHIVDGELGGPALPLVLGHQIVGRVEASGPGAGRFPVGTRVGVPWLASTCGSCRFCNGGRENLCERASFTGYTRPGGFAEKAIADERYGLALPADPPATTLAPLLCGGLIGHRALRIAGPAHRLGIYGYGAAGHLVAQLAVSEGREVYAFTRPGDEAAQSLARANGAVWAGASSERPPQPLDAAIIFAPIGSLVPAALAATDRGGRVVCAGIHMSDIPSFPYALLWEERSIASVANLTREDGRTFAEALRGRKVEASVTVFALSEANEALEALRDGRVTGAAVLEV